MIEKDVPEKEILFVKVHDKRWRVFVNGEDLNASFQYPWDALQCALNGSLTGVPIATLEVIRLECSTIPDHGKVAQVREAEARQRDLLASLRGIDGEGI